MNDKLLPSEKHGHSGHPLRPVQALSPVRSDALLAEAIALLRAADCPNCDGSGGVPRQVAEEQWELDQCQWCDELHSLFDRYTASAQSQRQSEAAEKGSKT